ncbi:MAG: zf-HC2 domain-containing protein [Clostridia bacterium]|nr:zf-HC2 domain-containing protein [Clostridia bacterium]
MTCEEIKAKLNEYIDSELSKEETMDFEMHLYDCEDCKKEYVALKELGEAVRETQCTDLPEDFEIAIPKNNKVISLLKKYQKTAAVMAAAIALILVVHAVRDMPGFITTEKPKDTAQTEEYIKDDSKEESNSETVSAVSDVDVSEDQKSEDTDNTAAPAKTPEKKEQSTPQQSVHETKKESAKRDNNTTAAEVKEDASSSNAQSADTEVTKPEPTRPQTTDRGEAIPEADNEAAEDTAAGGGSYNSYSASYDGSTPMKNESAQNSAKSASGGTALKSVDVSPVLSYSIPSADSFANPDLYSDFSSRLSSLKSRASSASEGEKQAILNEFNSLQAEISYNLK